MFGFNLGVAGASGGGLTSLIKSIQQISVTIVSASTSNTVTISSVNTAKTVLFYRGFTNTGTGTSWNGFLAKTNPSFTLTNSTTVTATKGDTGYGDTTLYLTVVEFNTSAVTSLQRGTIALTSASSNTATISSVNTSNSVCFWEGTKAASGGNGQSFNGYVLLTNGTTVTATRNDSSSTTSTVGYCVVQFATAAINSVQQNDITISSASSKNTTITSVNQGSTILIYGGYSTGNANVRNDLMRFRLSDSTTINITNNGGSSTSGTHYAVTALEFKSSFVNSLQRPGAGIDISGSSGTATISSVNTALSIDNYNSIVIAGDGNPTVVCAATSLASSTSVSLFISGSTGTGPSSFFEAIEFK